MPFERETRTEQYVGELTVHITGTFDKDPAEGGVPTYVAQGRAVTRDTTDKNFREVTQADLIAALPPAIKLQARDLMEAIYAWAKPLLLP